ncbi:chromosome partitioning protein ParB [Brevibacterium casei]|uniref:Chromosome partitioning protein ParB n=1 Tax=Brevibacterium casei TaxID=33889 RepID=A0A269ZDN1_9MICO|nr:ParB N-terminal domain-containing protein [Brevibacterium casei]PAK95620.1 chromosome partitioning protein ParB [Brevibacterium casei]
MSFDPGHIELEWVVESIRVGRRHRTELGDIDELAASIARDGLLQPITVTPDGVLVCGARRLAAIKGLGEKKVNVWVRSGLSDRLGQLLAEQDDNMLHKPLTQREAAALYRELKQVMAEDAARREAATRFSSQYQPRWNGEGNFPDPLETPLGRADEQAAAMIPGGASYKTMEKICYLEQIVADPAQPESLRAEAQAGLERIESGAPVHPIYQTVRDAAIAAQDAREADLHQMADEAVARARAAKKQKGKTPAPRPVPLIGADGEPARYPVRAFIHTWGELTEWWTHYDASQLAAELSDEQIESFLNTAEGTSGFAEELRAARDREPADDAPSARGHLRAL